MPDIGSVAEAEVLANRILETAREPLQLENGPVVATVSVGIALMPRQGSTPEALLSAADRALYEAKRLGRDRLVVWL